MEYKKMKIDLSLLLKFWNPKFDYKNSEVFAIKIE